MTMRIVSFLEILASPILVSRLLLGDFVLKFNNNINNNNYYFNDTIIIIENISSYLPMVSKIV